MEEDRTTNCNFVDAQSYPKAEPGKIDGISLHIQSTEDIIHSLKDGKRAWIVCLASFLIQVWVVGILHAFGVFFVAFLEEFQCTKAEAAWAGSAAYGLTMMLTPMASMLITRFGHRPVAATGCVICGLAMIGSSYATSIYQLFGSFTFLFAFGCCLAYTPCMTIGSDYFDKYLTLATGIMTAGTSTGTLLLSPIAQAIVSHYGWRNTFRFFGCTCGIGVVSSLVFTPLRLRPRSSVDRIQASMARQHMNELQLWKNKVYIIWICAIFFVMFGYYIPYVHLMSYAKEIGLTPSMASVLMMTLGGATASGRVLFGKVLAKGFLDRLRMDQLSMVLTGTAVMLLPLCRTFGTVLAYVLVVGLVDGCYVVLLPTLTEAFTSEARKVLAWGFLNFFCSISFTLGPPVAGWLYDATGSYNMSFHVAGIPIIIGAVCLCFIPWAQKTARASNLMAAAQSYNVMPSAPDSPIQDTALQSSGQEELVGSLGTYPIRIPTQQPDTLEALEMQTIRSPLIVHNREVFTPHEEQPMGAFIVVDLEKERVMAFSQQEAWDETNTDEVLLKAIDVIQCKSGGVVSLQRSTNVLRNGWSIEKFSVASPHSFRTNSPLTSTLTSPHSMMGSQSLYPTSSQLGRTPRTSTNSQTSTQQVVSKQTSAIACRGTESATACTLCIVSPLLDGNEAFPTLSSPRTPTGSTVADDSTVPVITVASPSQTAPFLPILSNPSLPSIAEVVPHSHEQSKMGGSALQNQQVVVERTEYAIQDILSSTPSQERPRQDAMFRISDISLSNFDLDSGGEKDPDSSH